MNESLLPRVISLIQVFGGELARTRRFEADYQYTEQFLDFHNFDEVIVICIDPPGSNLDGFSAFVTQTLPGCFLPVTLGGGISSVADAQRMFDLGADRIVLGSILFSAPHVIEDVVNIWGSQAVVGSVAVTTAEGVLMAVPSRRTRELVCSAEVALQHLQSLGVGEILINSVDRDGSLEGLDGAAIGKLTRGITVPFILAGGIGNWGHMAEGIADLGAAGVATSNIYHLTPEAVSAAKEFLVSRNIPVRAPRSSIGVVKPC